MNEQMTLKDLRQILLQVQELSGAPVMLCLKDKDGYEYFGELVDGPYSVVRGKSGTIYLSGKLTQVHDNGCESQRATPQLLDSNTIAALHPSTRQPNQDEMAALPQPDPASEEAYCLADDPDFQAELDKWEWADNPDGPGQIAVRPKPHRVGIWLWPNDLDEVLIALQACARPEAKRVHEDITEQAEGFWPEDGNVG